MPSIESIWRYPIKGLTPERLNAVTLTPGRCLPHDRRFESGETCKINQRDVLAGRRIGLALRIGKTVSNRLNETWPFVQAQERADEPTEPGA